MSRRRLNGPPVVYRLLPGLLYCLWCELAIGSPSACAPQGLLQLDKPYPPPYRVRLPFCSQYECSCCNASHALTIQRSVRHLMLDDELSQLCKSGLIILACSVCDPEVGVGHVTAVCSHMCQKLFEDCSKDFFAYDDSTGSVTPCSSQSGMSLVCSQLTEVVHHGAAFCRALGHASSHVDDTKPPCFEGVVAGPSDCPLPPKKPCDQEGSLGVLASLTTRHLWPMGSSVGARTKQAGQLLLGALTMASVAVAVMCILHWLVKRGPEKLVKSTAVDNLRDVLAKAADTRAAKGHGHDPHQYALGDAVAGVVQRQGRRGKL